MNALVVFDSQYGNTERVARRIAAELEGLGVVRVASVRRGDPTDLVDIELLVVGGPTQGHGIGQPLRRWIEGQSPDAFAGIAAATFDTRLRWPVFLSGSAARSLATILTHGGAQVIAEPGSFLVGGKEGPLIEGELERAAAWAAAIARDMARRVPEAATAGS